MSDPPVYSDWDHETEMREAGWELMDAPDQGIINEPTVTIVGDKNDFANAAELLEEIERLRSIINDERQLAFVGAVTILEELKTNTEAEEWTMPSMKRAVLSGVTMCIQRLKNEAAKR